ncbi:hypothetical protein SPB21_17425 [Leptothoe sp. ISB3NOV94-8A]|nr:hypothetical protein [Adonisia turfae]MDV3350968.1 hypothetical protein [Leptothoe sp. LEGE 181152]NEZ59889.1 hypothetical protein [Adonisia turfae CCMR0081]
MKNSFNNPPSNNGALCSLCQDTLLRHISQSRMFWYCPSCRQEMVVSESEDELLPHAAVVNQVGQMPQHCPPAKAENYNKPMSVQAAS